MPFKIVQVQTVRGNRVLRVVPFNWEKSGILYWPTINPDNVRSLEHSVPDETWSELKCVVKKTNIVNFHTAETLLEKMHNDPPVFLNVDTNGDFATPGNSDDVSNAELSSMSTKMYTMMQMIKTFQTNQNKLLHNQRIILSKLSEISSQLEDLSKQPAWPNIENATAPCISISGFDIKTIENEEDLKNFESMLENPIIEAELFQKFKVICGKGRGKAENNAYTLLDIMFTREFMQACSWSGGSRSDVPKICFKSYNNTLNFFFKVVHESDASFTMVDCHLFFKGILKNSRKRCESKRIRMSTARKKSKLRHHEGHYETEREQQDKEDA